MNYSHSAEASQNKVPTRGTPDKVFQRNAKTKAVNTGNPVANGEPFVFERFQVGVRLQKPFHQAAAKIAVIVVLLVLFLFKFPRMPNIKKRKS